MTGKRYRIHDIQTLGNRNFFFDTNILIYLFWPIGNLNHSQKLYSTIFKDLLGQKSKLFVDFNVISEFVNSALRTEWNMRLANLPGLKFKDFRNSPDGQTAISDIFNQVKTKILFFFDILEKGFSKQEIDGFLALDSLDFQDKGIAAICRENHFVLLTNDSDFSGTDIDILTANNKI